MKDKLYLISDGLLQFKCPGCGYGHPFAIKPIAHPEGKVWEWNGSMSAPTFKPSLIINKDYPSALCHLVMTDGKIAFLDDCHHKLAGQTVDMLDVED